MLAPYDWYNLNKMKWWWYCIICCNNILQSISFLFKHICKNYNFYDMFVACHVSYQFGLTNNIVLVPQFLNVLYLLYLQ